MLQIELPREVESLPLVGAEQGVREALEAAARQRLGALRVPVGLSEQSAFNRAFRRWFGATPSEVRERAFVKGGR